MEKCRWNSRNRKFNVLMRTILKYLFFVLRLPFGERIERMFEIAKNAECPTRLAGKLIVIYFHIHRTHNN